jgi:hypothetical protein
MSLAGMALIAAAAIVVILLIVQVISLAGPQSFLSTVILGEDGRTSTSKTFILMWTLLVGWALITLLIAGEFVSAHRCLSAKVAHPCSQDQVGLLQMSWKHFLSAHLAGTYLILLGIPGAAGVLAKGITQQQVNSPTGFKTTKPDSQFTSGQDRAWARFRRRFAHPLQAFGQFIARLTEVFSADDGSTDLADFQYLIFNLITAVYFVVRMVNPDGKGLPTIPETLLGLTGVSATVYVGKKAVSRAQPAITGVFPQPIHDGSEFTIIGSSLGEDPSAQNGAPPQISIDGMPVTLMRVSDSGNLIVKAPPDLSQSGTPAVRQLQVLNPYGGLTAKFDVQCL